MLSYSVGNRAHLPLNSKRRLDHGKKLHFEGLELRQMLSATLFVDATHHTYHNAKYTTIQAAVNAAHSGDTIIVAPGVYRESVTVNKTLQIYGAYAGADGARALHRMPRNETIVDVSTFTDLSGFYLQANKIVIDGFTVTGANGNAAGIQTSNTTSGDRISNDVLINNTSGLYLNSEDNFTTTVRNDLFKTNNVAGAASGNGIYSDQGLADAIIRDNHFTGQTNASIIMVGNGGVYGPQISQEDIQVIGNVMENDAPLIFVNTTELKIIGNFSRNSVGSGIFFGGDVTYTQVIGNTLLDGAFTGINLATNSFGNAPDPNSNIVIRGNTILRFGDSGIRLRDGANHVAVTDNTVLRNGTGNDPTTGDGISLEGATMNTILRNVSERNRRDGFRVDAASVDNILEHNVAFDNGEFDYFDASVGTGTAGTANHYRHNHGRTQNVPGLIS